MFHSFRAAGLLGQASSGIRMIIQTLNPKLIQQQLWILPLLILAKEKVSQVRPMSALTPCAYTRNRRISLFFWIPSGSTLFAHVDDGHLAINGSASSSALDKTMRLLRSVVFFATLLILTRDLPPQSLLASLSNLHYSPETRCSHVHSMARRSIHKLPQPEHPQRSHRQVSSRVPLWIPESARGL